MKKGFFILFASVVLITALIAAFPEIRDELHWQWASYKDQEEDYADYLETWPAGRHTREARDLYDERSWARVKAYNTVLAFEKYLQTHPEGAYVQQAEEEIENFHWQRARGRNTPLAYQQYIDAYPAGSFVGEAKAKKEALLKDNAPFLAAKKSGLRQAYETFLAEYPGHARENAARSALKDMEGRDIVDLLKQRKVEVKTQGSGIQSVTLKIRRLVNHNVLVRVPVGTFFVSRNPSAQNMVVTQEKAVTLSDDQEVSLRVPAACANRPRDIPDSDDSFYVRRSPQQKDLAKLIPVLRKATTNIAVRQAAVWIVTDNADYGDLGSLVSRSAFQMFGGTRVINEYEAAMAMKICDEAGINIKRKAIWRDFNKILNGLEDKSLKAWLKQNAAR